METVYPQSFMSKPSVRRDGREAAVQYLFGHESLAEAESDEEFLPGFWLLREAKNPRVREFAEKLITGFRINQVAVDEMLSGALHHFRMERLNAVDRSILRLGAYEIVFADHIPPQAALNEAIEIAKRFGAEDSPRFVNGVLDRILKQSLETEKR